jgi:hypothetical protein
MSQERFQKLLAVTESDDAGDLVNTRRVEADVLERPVDKTGPTFGPDVSENGRITGGNHRGKVRSK